MARPHVIVPVFLSVCVLSLVAFRVSTAEPLEPPLFDVIIGVPNVVCSALDEEHGKAYLVVTLDPTELSPEVSLAVRVVDVIQAKLGSESVGVGTMASSRLGLPVVRASDPIARTPVHCAFEPQWGTGYFFVAHAESPQIARVPRWISMSHFGSRTAERITIPTNSTCSETSNCITGLVMDRHGPTLVVAYSQSSALHYLRLRSDVPWGTYDLEVDDVTSRNTWAVDVSTMFGFPQPTIGGVIFASTYDDPHVLGRELFIEQLITEPFGRPGGSSAVTTKQASTSEWVAGGSTNFDHIASMLREDRSVFEAEAPSLEHFSTRTIPLSLAGSFMSHGLGVSCSVPGVTCTAICTAVDRGLEMVFMMVGKYAVGAAVNASILGFYPTLYESVAKEGEFEGEGQAMMLDHVERMLYIALRSVSQGPLRLLGISLDQYDCDAVDNCTNHGACVSRNVCECEEGFTGITCSSSINFVHEDDLILDDGHAYDDFQEGFDSEDKSESMEEGMTPIGDEGICCSVMDEARGFLYHVTTSFRVIKVNALHPALEKVANGTVHLTEAPSSGDRMYCALDSELGYLYVGLRNHITIARVNADTLAYGGPGSEDELALAATIEDCGVRSFSLDSKDHFLYVSSGGSCWMPMTPRVIAVINLQTWDVSKPEPVVPSMVVQTSLLSPDRQRLYVFGVTQTEMRTQVDTLVVHVFDVNLSDHNLTALESSPFSIATPEDFLFSFPDVYTQAIDASGELIYLGGPYQLLLRLNTSQFGTPDVVATSLPLVPSESGLITVVSLALDSAYPHLYYIGRISSSPTQFTPSFLVQLDVSTLSFTHYELSDKYTESAMRTVTLDTQRRWGYFASSPILRIEYGQYELESVAVSTIHKYSLPHFACENDCNGHGECVGPNICVCEPGFLDPFCEAPQDHAACSEHSSCHRCLRERECGWCNTLEGTCIDGNADGPLTRTGEVCDDWFYDKCPARDAAEVLGDAATITVGATVGVTLGVQGLLLVLGGEAQSVISAATAPLTTSLWILFDLCQDIGMFGMMGIDWPTDYLRFTQAFSWMLGYFDVSVNSLRFDLDDEKGTSRHLLALKEYSRGLGIGMENLLVMSLIVFVGLLAFFAFCYNISKYTVLALSAQSRYRRRKKALKNVYVKATLRLLMIATFGVSIAASIHIMLTGQVTDSHGIFRGILYAIAWLVLLFLLGFIGSVFLILWRNRGNVDTAEFRKRFNPLVMKYNNPNFMFVLVYLMIKFSKGASIGFLQALEKVQCIVLLTLQVLYFVLVLIRRPFVDVIYDRLEIIICLCNMVAISIAVKFAFAGGGTGLAWTMIILQFTVVVLIFISHFVLMRHSFVALFRAMRGRDADGVRFSVVIRQERKSTTEIEMGSIKAQSRDQIMKFSSISSSTVNSKDDTTDT